MDREESVQHFLDLIKKSRRGKFKVYRYDCRCRQIVPDAPGST